MIGARGPVAFGSASDGLAGRRARSLRACAGRPGWAFATSTAAAATTLAVVRRPIVRRPIVRRPIALRPTARWPGVARGVAAAFARAPGRGLAVRALGRTRFGGTLLARPIAAVVAI